MGACILSMWAITVPLKNKERDFARPEKVKFENRLCILLAKPHAAEQVIFFEELVIQSCANM